MESEFVAHCLRVFGFKEASAELLGRGMPLVLCCPTAENIPFVEVSLRQGSPVLAILPKANFLEWCGFSCRPYNRRPPFAVVPVQGSQCLPLTLRTLHEIQVFKHEKVGCKCETLVQTDDGELLWIAVRMHKSWLYLMGTDLAGDLTRYRQGDPSEVDRKHEGQRWGFPGERPNYLYEAQLGSEPPHERYSDWWLWQLRNALTHLAELRPEPLLPANALGAIVITGDDDQADLSFYEQQAKALGGLPITYFLHPKTKHTRSTISQRSRLSKVDWELHPDALDAPAQYTELFHQQYEWFSEFVGRPPKAIRNHGFLNDGYWGHAEAWTSHGVRCSSNLPGLDGRIINGSLLPSKLYLHGKVQDHWSILTAIGDGAIFVKHLSADEGADLVRQTGKLILSSGVPGVFVLNLHPENIARTLKMHEAVRELVDDGFIAWTMSEMVEWFDARERSQDAGH
jgi:hypothetical protein